MGNSKSPSSRRFAQRYGLGLAAPSLVSELDTFTQTMVDSATDEGLYNVLVQGRNDSAEIAETRRAQGQASREYAQTTYGHEGSPVKPTHVKLVGRRQRRLVLRTIHGKQSRP